MTAEPNKPCQIKRDYLQLINLYPATAHTDAHYLSKLSIYQQRVFEAHSQQKLLVLGQMGLGNGLELLSWWRTQTNPNQRLLLKVFEPHPINAYELKLLWDQSASLTKVPELEPLAQRLLHTEPTAIIGCQRLIFDDGRTTIDLHFGDIQSQLSSLINSPLHPVQHWLVLPHLQNGLHQQIHWQMAKLSDDGATVATIGLNESSGLSETTVNRFQACGFEVRDFTCAEIQTNPQPDAILLHERHVLRQQDAKAYAFNPMAAILPSVPPSSIAIIGGGLASAHLALSLAERGQSTQIFCKDAKLGQGASGNRQGAIYPLLTPENDELSRFFQQAFLFSRRRVQALTSVPAPNQTPISHNFCGVLQTAHDERSQLRLDKIIQSQNWPSEIAYRVDAQQANSLANINIDKSGFFYPLAGWVCPYEYAEAALQKAQQLTEVKLHLETEILEIEHQSEGWYLITAKHRFGPFAQVVLANGAALTQFDASNKLQISPFRGQVSHVPTQFQLSQLATVLCANGYLTPSHQGLHCLGASYVKEPKHLDFCPQEQQENLAKMHESYPDQGWLDDIDMSGNNARVGVRMVTRDHFPMMGCAPDVAKILEDYEQHQLTKESRHYWQTTPAPVHQGLYILGGLGSRGLSSGPLAAECLAAQLCGEPIPLDKATLCKLNPNRMWLRKLLKGKSL
ncbi:FAD-dependent 5-carboxymethylaminomethyl-2-thiouridine(34) oxidoreductase MnmC [Shewanella putrefaciens]|uniref:tRNA 5-methylaminomethyl-2-thiouridine biosynthesis bifunctional protein MnmC n=1 Tax=Shewanella putrefaciens TaxID=24 RepID=A0ABX8X942_SHEPU|nr:FAD-dependent 5-carboxymethylaminomethyl-2-thiouridine(34) oxidoreductase MnmC [Shewanella putrefaciens]AVV86147.1 FAD-dependent cmnm(5)s(2)U34 oxidoreductase [Shewanella putrefaciens]MCT8944135.1 FAD-dependent 5-carboxymethylaminomethyl-2-thiouridine(34) oxidoreductase MnmC [Shewanella putrefaciens]QSE48146.1 FAD-dependent 5-carboxymethylaminomethyl-2-thiouridine(34) oxidoreductase MnmC [Shewanella putrefaciens]QYX71550.1 FAD-dependent 5-carboxymethylaminomethyl-2-thiouridine(34) oxidoreduc